MTGVVALWETWYGLEQSESLPPEEIGGNVVVSAVEEEKEEDGDYFPMFEVQLVVEMEVDFLMLVEGYAIEKVAADLVVVGGFDDGGYVFHISSGNLRKER